MGQYNRIAKAIEELNIYSEKIRLMESEQERTMGLRQLVVDNYLVLYVIENERVIVMRVLYSPSDIKVRLKG